ncbi:uncharacterized protein PV07_12551 [Cladophialophora immunda]|uniref:Uncharacterized protein n=1 Tax=Cladophialophora immunda TaxID=569365 RepID=A0A0D2BUI0_9EURO|nr:uncharacterized protein PV07_12551 [Cladophialophora immunda]KIW22045.1 hypothetical protein PV07_12551 [Cladophialophora immunda]
MRWIDVPSFGMMGWNLNHAMAVTIKGSLSALHVSQWAVVEVAIAVISLLPVLLVERVLHSVWLIPRSRISQVPDPPLDPYDADNPALTDADWQCIQDFHQALESDKLEECLRCREKWFDMNLNLASVCARCIRVDSIHPKRRGKDTDPFLYSHDIEIATDRSYRGKLSTRWRDGDMVLVGLAWSRTGRCSDGFVGHSSIYYYAPLMVVVYTTL